MEPKISLPHSQQPATLDESKNKELLLTLFMEAFLKFRLFLFQAKDQQSNQKFQSSLEAKLEEDLSNMPRRKGSIDVHIVESHTQSSTEVTTVKTEGDCACTIKYNVSRHNL
jgi:hypothetical protein